MSTLELTEEDLVRAASMRVAAGKPASITAEQIEREVAVAHGLTVAVLRSRLRYGPICRARADLYRRLRAAPMRWSYPMIGKYIGRDHTTIMYALRAKPSRLPKATPRTPEAA